jgi:hypothetical protein
MQQEIANKSNGEYLLVLGTSVEGSKFLFIGLGTKIHKSTAN